MNISYSGAEIIQMSEVPIVRIRISQSELVDFVFSIESERETKHVVILMLR